MTTDEIHEKIQNIDNWGDIPAILEHMNNKIAELEKRVEELKRSASRTANIASCLANGIQPD